MTDKEKAEFILAILDNDGVMIPAALAEKLVECKTWMRQWPKESVSIRKV